TLINGGTAQFNSNDSTATLSMSSGTLGGTGTIAVTTSMSWTGGTMADAGTTVINAGAVLNIPVSSTKTIAARTLVNNGSTICSDTGTSINGSGNASIINAGT